MDIRARLAAIALLAVLGGPIARARAPDGSQPQGMGMGRTGMVHGMMGSMMGSMMGGMMGGGSGGGMMGGGGRPNDQWRHGGHDKQTRRPHGVTPD